MTQTVKSGQTRPGHGLAVIWPEKGQADLHLSRSVKAETYWDHNGASLTKFVQELLNKKKKNMMTKTITVKLRKEN